MPYKIETFLVIKNDKNEYYTDRGYDADRRWDANIKAAKEYNMQALLADIKRDREDNEVWEGYNIFKEGLYTVETKIRVEDIG